MIFPPLKLIEMTSSSSESPVLQTINKGQPVVILFHMTGCGYCKEILPIWKSLPHLPGMFDIEQSSAPILLKKYNVVGFPTLMYIHGNQTEIYEKERTKEAMEAWIRGHLPQTGGRRRRHRRTRRRRRTRTRHKKRG